VSAAASHLDRIYRGLEALYQTDTGLSPSDVLIPFERSTEAMPRELLLLRESDDGELEVGLVLDVASLARLERGSLDDALADARLGETLPILEGLSHLVYVAEAARQERPVSALELETQAEVDKFAICLLHRWQSGRTDFDRLIERLFYRFELAPLSEDLHERYRQANRTALGFSRSLRRHVESGSIAGLREALRRFWHASMSFKRAYAGG
jgi:hypothetical protein